MKGARCLWTMLFGFTNARSISLLYVLDRCTIVNYTIVSWRDLFKSPMDVEIIAQAPYRRREFAISWTLAEGMVATAMACNRPLVGSNKLIDTALESCHRGMGQQRCPLPLS